MDRPGSWKWPYADCIATRPGPTSRSSSERGAASRWKNPSDFACGLSTCSIICTLGSLYSSAVGLSRMCSPGASTRTTRRRARGSAGAPVSAARRSDPSSSRPDSASRSRRRSGSRTTRWSRRSRRSSGRRAHEHVLADVDRVPGAIGIARISPGASRENATRPDRRRPACGSASRRRCASTRPHGSRPSRRRLFPQQLVVREVHAVALREREVRDRHDRALELKRRAPVWMRARSRSAAAAASRSPSPLRMSSGAPQPTQLGLCSASPGVPQQGQADIIRRSRGGDTSTGSRCDRGR